MHLRRSLSVVLAMVVCLLIVEAFPASMAAAATRKAPYLIYPGDNSKMEVLWQLTVVDSCTIEWGTDQTYSLGNVWTHEYGTIHQHGYTIADLVPGTVYFYRVTAGAEQFAGSFRAAPPTDAADLKFFAYGDTRSYPADHNRVAGGVISTYTADPDYQTFILSVGDLVYNGDTETDWDNQFFSASYPNIRTMLGHLPYQACMGNHEQTGALFTKYFPYPFVGGRYWSFDYGPAHFAVVDQYTPYGPSTAQLLWLAADLDSTDKPWKFVVLHEPGWSAGGGHTNNTSVQTYIQPLCEQKGVAILFAGHNHYYARAIVNGIQHVTTGGGGAPLNIPVPTYPNLVATAKVYHYCTIEIDGSSLHFTALTPADSVADSLTLYLPNSGVGPDRGANDTGEPTMGRASPSPFTGATSFEYSIPWTAAVELAVYDVSGRVVATLVDAELPRGSRRAVWNGKNSVGREVSPGIYVCRLLVGDAIRTSKVVLLK